MKVYTAAFSRILCILFLFPFVAESQDNALLFDDSNDLIAFSSEPNFNGSANRTFEAWINPSTTTGTQTILGWDNSGGEILNFHINNGVLQIFMDDGDTQSGSVTGSKTILTNQWTHVAFVSTAGSFVFYVNGVAESVGSPAASVGNLDDLVLGASASATNHFGGFMDEVRVWSAALDETAIRTQMFSSLLGSETDLVAYYEFNETTGTSLPDLTSNNFDGTLVNFPTSTDPNWQTSTALTQPASPGGVFFNLILWLRADVGTTVDTGVDTWEDQSVAGNDVSQSTGTDQPALTSSGLNYQPVLTFDGTDELITTSTGLIGGGDYTKIAVSRVTNASVPSNIISAAGTGDHAIYYNNGVPTIFHSGNEANSIGSELNNSIIFAATYDLGGSTVLQQHIDGANTANSNSVNTYVDPSATSIGSYQGGSGMVGDIAEAIMFDTNISAADRRKIESYLAAKYGISRITSPIEDYLASDGSAMWDESGFSGFLDDITVIGRDDLSGLNQKQSRSANADRIVSIGIGTIAADNQTNTNTFDTDLNFLSWANDDGDDNSYTTTGVTGLSNIANRLERRWMVDEQGSNIDDLTVQFDLSGSSPPSSSAIDYKLLIDDDGVDFSNAVIVDADSYSSDIVEFSGVDLSDGDIFALGIRAPSYVVTNSNDSGEGSLRQAMLDANASSEEVITFNIPGSNNVIDLLTDLPDITSSMTIDGTSQPGWIFADVSTMVVIDGSTPSASDQNGFYVNAANTTIKGLVLTDFDDGSTGNQNGAIKVVANNFTIGGVNEGNIIHHNRNSGIYVVGASGGVIQGNRIGTTPDGTARSGGASTQQNGIAISGSTNITIGGDSSMGEGNLISGYDIVGPNSHGILIASTSTVINIYGNQIGTNAAGDDAIRNTEGIRVTTGSNNVNIGGSGTGQGNIIGANSSVGISIGATAFDVTIESNRFGSSADGVSALSAVENTYGIVLDDGAVTVTINNNLMVNLSGPAIDVNTTDPTGITITNNLIGVNVGGQTEIGVFSTAIQLDGGGGTGTVISGNTIAGSSSYGILVGAGTTDITIQSNNIGVFADGTATGTGNPQNNDSGIRLNNADGTDNGANRIAILDNIISGNGDASGDDGIEIVNGSSNILIQGNKIGVETDGTTLLGNYESGILLSSTATNVQIGGSGSGEANIIADNDYGIRTTATSFSTVDVQENSIFCNSLQGIEIAATEVVPPPVITSATPTLISGTTTVEDNANILLFEADDGCGDDQGMTLVAEAVDVVSSGFWSIAGSFTLGTNYTAIVVDDETTVDAAFGASEFSVAAIGYPSVPGSGYALNFDGSNDEVNVSDLSVSGNVFSFEAWVKRDRINAGSFTDRIIASDANNGFAVYFDPSNRLTISHVGVSEDISTATVDDLGWHHIAVTYDGINASYYLDGDLKTTNSYGVTFSSVTGYTIGNRTAQSEHFDGLIDEVRFWNVVLDETTIRDWVTQKLTSAHPDYSNLEGYYRFDENTGSVATDLAGANHGTLNGATYNLSGAHLGDESAFTTTTSVALSSASSGNNLTINNILGSPDITYVYRVNEAPNNTTVTSELNALNTTDYYGVFQSGGTNPTFNAQWFYSGNSGVNGQPDENGIRFVKRANNADGVFDELSSSFLDVNTSTNIVIDANLTSGEFAQGITDAYAEPSAPGNTLNFDGTDDVVDLGTGLESVFAGANKQFTIEAWINPETFTGSNRKIILAKNGNTINCSSDERQLGFAISLDEGLRFVYYGANDLSQFRVFESGNGSIVANTWQHVAMTYNGSIDTGDGSDRVSFYINGVLQPTNLSLAVGAFPFDITSGSSHVGLGATLDSSGGLCEASDQIFDGPMDEVRIWDTVLDQEDILSHIAQEVDNTHPNYDNLRAYYRFDDSDGTSSVSTLRDLAGANDGTLTNFPADNSGNWGSSGALDPSIFPNNALDFNGTSDFVFLPAAVELTSQTASTVEAWFRIDGDPADFQTIYSEENSGGATFYILRTVGNVVQYGVYDGSVWSFSTGSTQLEAGRWYHVAATYEDGVGTKIYLDGNLEDENSEDGRSSLGGAGGRKLGHQGVVNYYFDGALDEVRIWTKAKTLTEIRSEIFTPLAGSESMLLAYYDFNQGVPTANNAGETTLIDGTANGLDGTLTSFTLDGDNSNWAFSGSLDPTPNEPIDLLTTEVSDTQIDLDWTDRSFTETQFLIERSDGHNSSFVQIGTASADDVSYSDNTVTAGNGYFYRVRATNGTENSPYSNEKFGSTIAQPGNALDFDGVDDHIRVSDHPSLQFGTSDFTVEGWVYFDGVPQNGSIILKLNLAVPNDNLGVTIRDEFFSTTPGSKLSASLWPDNRAGSTSSKEPVDRLLISSDLSTGWHHFAMVNDYDTEARLYVDGILVDTDNSDHSGGGFNVAGTDILFGENNDPWDSEAPIDEVRFWNVARTQTEIQENMSFPLTGNESGLVAYYRFDQGVAGGDNTTPSVDVLPDRSMNNNHGLLQNFDLNGGASNWITSGADLDPPNAPSDLFVTEVSNTQIDLSWTDNSAKETGFAIERSDGNNTTWVNINSVGPDVTSYSDNTVTAGKGYYYRVIATGPLDSSPSNEKFGGTYDVPGNSISFDGVDDEVEVLGVSELPTGTDQRTMELWFKATQDAATYGDQIASIIRQADDADGDGNLFAIAQFIVGGVNTIGFWGNDQNVFGTAGEIELNRWYHAAAVWDGVNMKVYLDGQEVLSGTPLVNTTGPNANNLWLAAESSNGYGDYFGGEVDEVRIWSDVRTEGEIQGNMFNSLVGNEDGLVTYYKVDQDEATDLLIPDRSANNNNGIWMDAGGGVTTPIWPTSEAFTPHPPSDLFTTEVSDTQIDLSWTDNSPNETDFLIERSDGNNTSFSQIGTAPADATSYTDNTVVAGNGYFYRIRATNGTQNSSYSNEKFGSTLTPPGNALNFDGTDDYIDVGDIGLDFTSSAFTIEFWARRTTAGNNDWIVSVGTEPSSTNEAIHVGFRSGNTFTIDFKGNSLDTDQTFTDTEWHHWAVVYDPDLISDDDDRQIYRDGILLKADDPTGDFIGVNDLKIGQAFDSEFLNGDVDELRIWNVARSGTEIESDFATSLVGNESGLIAYYRFDQDEVTDHLLPDRSTNNNSGIWTDAGGGETQPDWVGSGAFTLGGVVPEDYNALLALYNDTDGANWTDNTNWLSGDVSTWFGISVVGDQVSEIELGTNNLVGTIPAELGTLTEMTNLELFENQLTGSIPTTLGDLSNLQYLELYSNQLSGSIPTELGFLSDLLDLELDDNLLTGSIPTELGDLNSLIQLDLATNQLSGSIPSQLGMLANLQYLELFDNNLSGSIPTEIGDLTNLLELELDGNMLTGAIPAELGSLTNLQLLDLTNNQLSASIPTQIGNLVNAVRIDLDDNDLTGSIPTSISTLTSLEDFDLSNNQLTGSIPTEIGDLSSLVNLLLYANQLSGSIPVEIGSLTNLEDLDLSHNQLTGSIPTEIGMLTALTHLELDDNQLSGTIPSEIGSLTLLQDLQLDINQFTGAVPTSFTSLTALTNLELSDNALTDLPDLSALTGLSALLLANNQFEFDDLEPNVAIPGVDYVPQANLTGLPDVDLNEDDNLDVTRTVGGTANQYQWLKDAVDISGQTTDNLSISTVVPSDAGAYHLEVTNTLVTGLTISSDPFDVTVDAKPTVVTQDISVSLDATGNISITPSQIDNGSSDDVTIAANLALSLDVTDFDCTNVGGNIVTLTVTDESGNSSNATASVTVNDDLNPTVVGQDIAVSLDATGNVSITPGDVDNGSSDNCSVNLSLDVTDFDCTNIGPNVVTLTATDDEGNSANTTATVTVNDDLSPTVVAQDIAVSLDATGNISITPGDVDNGSSDNCSVNLSLDITDFDCTNIGPNVVTLTATDDEGNSANTTATITVSDDLNPTAVAQDIAVSLDATGNISITSGDVDNGSSDNCSVNLSLDVTDFDCTNVGPNVVTLTATDDEGNSVNTTATVTVNDDLNPTVVAQDIAVSLDATGNVSITPVDVDNGSSDNCSVNLSLDVTDFDCTNVGPNVVTLTATDDEGNSANTTATVTVNDDLNPTAVAQDIAVSLDVTGNISITPGDVDNGSSDNCLVNLSLDITDFDCTNIGPNVVTLTATDDEGNSANTTATVTVNDDLIPTVVAQDIAVSLDAAGNISITPGDVDNGSSDNCSVNLSLDVTDFDCTNVGPNVVTLTVTDDEGNSVNTTATVMINDDLSPTAVAQDIAISLDATGNVSITPGDVDNGSSDNCSVNLSLDVTDFDCSDVGANTVTLTVTDDAGNNVNTTSTVTVMDSSDPMVATQDFTAFLDATGNVTISTSDVDNSSSDNCSLSLSLDITDFDCTNLGANTVMLTGLDGSGNSSVAAATVTVADNIDPMVVTQNIVVALDANDAASIVPADIDNGSSDNCSFSLSLDITSFTEADIGENTVMLTAIDAAGNSASAAATITVMRGNAAPVLAYIFYIDENTEAGTLIGAVAATDPEGDPLAYSIISGNTNDAFAIGSTTGEITVNSQEALDFETTPVFDLMVQADDGNGGISMVSITVNLIDIVDENPLSADKIENQVSVYPNPASESLFIELQGSTSKDIVVEMFTVSGSQVIANDRILLKSSHLIEINLDNLSSGIYLLKIKDGNQVFIKNVLLK